MEDTAKRIMEQVPKPFDFEMVMKKYPVLYEQSMNTVLAQEVIRLVTDAMGNNFICLIFLNFIEKYLKCKV